MKTRLSVSMFLLAAGVLPSHAGAAAYGDVQLCDGITLADDHVGAWGCWNSIEPTAAGPGTGGGTFMALPAGSPYRQNPAFSQAATFECPSGATCGYAVYWNIDNTNEPSPPTSQPYPAHLVATPGAIGEADGNGNMQVQVSIQLVPVNPDAPPPQVAQTGPMTIAYNTGSGSGQAILPKPYLVMGSRPGSNEDGLSPLVFGPYLVGNYVTGTSATTGLYVGGVETPSAAILTALADESRLSGKIATYTGRELINANPVTLSVNFGLASWSGTWGGETAWSATGTVTGAHIQSTGISGSYDAGQVKGTFYGRNAEALGGMVDVYKTGTPAIRHTDLFMADTKGLVSPPIVSVGRE